MKTSEVAAAHSVDVGRWSKGFDEVLGRIASRFSRCEPLRNAGASMLGLVSDLGRKNCWTLAERSGHRSPDRFQHLVARAKWAADAVRDDLRAYVVGPSRGPNAVLVVDMPTPELCRGVGGGAANRMGARWKVNGSQRRHSFTRGFATLLHMPHRAVKVVILGINYAPEPTGIAPYTTGLAMGLAERGHEVLVLTGHPHYPYWKPAEGSSRCRSEEQINGVRVRRLKHRVPRRLSWIGRAAMEFTFGLQLLTTRWGRPEVVICVSAPLLAAAMSAVRARLTWRRPAIGVLVQDLYSRGIAETGAASGLSARAVRVLESVAIRLGDGVAVIHKGFTDDLTGHLSVDIRRIREIRNWSHVSPPDPSASAAFREAHHWGADEVVVLHAGNMGYKQGLENVVAAAALAGRSNSRARFVLIGDGNQRASLEAAAAGVPALEFLPPVNEEEFPAALGAADVLLVNERPGVARMTLPSKLTSYFNSGKPILAATDATGLTAGELAASGAGVCVPADRPDLLLSEAIRLGTDRALGRQLGQAGLRYCYNLLSQESALDRYEQWVIDLADMHSAGHRGGG